MKKLILITCTAIILLSGCARINEIPPAGAAAIEPIPADISDHGISMIISDITPAGLSFAFENSTDKKYLYDSHYALYARKNDTWELAEPIIENWDWVFTDEGYSLLPNSSTDLTVIDWTWNLGALPDGDYKFKKTVLYVRRPGDFDAFVLEREFTLPHVNALNYAEFIKILETSGFTIEESGEDPPGMLAAGRKYIRTGDDFISVYEYDSNETMECDSAYISKCGFTISRPENSDGLGLEICISWIADPYFFKKDSLIVNYVGENSQIIDFLKENFGDVFAGHGYRE